MQEGLRAKHPPGCFWLLADFCFGQVGAACPQDCCPSVGAGGLSPPVALTACVCVFRHLSQHKILAHRGLCPSLGSHPPTTPIRNSVSPMTEARGKLCIPRLLHVSPGKNDLKLIFLAHTCPTETTCVGHEGMWAVLQVNGTSCPTAPFTASLLLVGISITPSTHLGVSSSEENSGTPVALHLTFISPFPQVMKGHAFPFLCFMSSLFPPLGIEKKSSMTYLAMLGCGYIDMSFKNVNTSPC